MEIALIVGQILLKYGPVVAQAWQKIFSIPNPTPEDWKAVWAVPHKTYDEYTSPKEP